MIAFVRHARTDKLRDRPVAAWPLAPDAAARCAELAHDLRDLGLGADATWVCSPEPKARQTAAHLTAAPVEVETDLREVRRGGWLEDYDATVARYFAAPDTPAGPGWETALAARTRFDAAVRRLATTHDGTDLVVVTHGLVLTTWWCAGRSARDTMARWQDLAMPDIRVLSTPARQQWLDGGSPRLEHRTVSTSGGTPR